MGYRLGIRIRVDLDSLDGDLGSRFGSGIWVGIWVDLDRDLGSRLGSGIAWGW